MQVDAAPAAAPAAAAAAAADGAPPGVSVVPAERLAPPPAAAASGSAATQDTNAFDNSLKRISSGRMFFRYFSSRNHMHTYGHTLTPRVACMPSCSGVAAY